MPFERLVGAFAFLSLIPFIILYLRRPKPTEQTVPSLMFFLRERGSTRFHSFLRQLIHNLLFLLQLLILSALAFSVMGFFTEVPVQDSGRVVIVLDVSGSMQADAGDGTRFEQALAEANDLLKGHTSVVLASNVPRVVAENIGAESARKILGTVEPLDTSTNLGDAILVARDLLRGKGEIVVLSDFIATEGIDPFVARSLVSQDSLVRFVNFGSDASNVGIVGMSPGKRTTTVKLRNFDDAGRQVGIRIVNDGDVKDDASMEISGRSVEEFTFDTLPGRTEVRLDVDDDFAADNVAYLSIPHNARIRALLITNSRNTNVEAALSASPDVVLDVAIPPVVSNFDYDVIILHAFDPELMLPGFYNEIEARANNGSSVVITGQEDLEDAGIRFLPVNLLGVGGVSRNIVNFTNYFTDGIDFGVNERYLEASPKEGATTIVSASNSPVVALAGKGSGNVVYYGLIDEYSSFKSSPSYPQFWNRLLNFLTETEDLDSFNFRTGRIDAVPEQVVSTPLGRLKTDRVLLDKAGFYSYNGRAIAANMLDPRESGVDADSASFSQEVKRIASEHSGLTEEKGFETELALLAAVLVFAELLFIKFRGDL